MSELPPPPTSGRPSMPVGRLLFGAFLVLLGIGWLLEALDVVTLDWELVLPVGLIGVGVALVVTARRIGGHGGLIALGIVLTLLLTVGTLVRIPFAAGVGDRTESPEMLADHTYELSIGKLTVDLTEATPTQTASAEVRVEAQVGMGQLVVIVPEAIPCVSTHAEAGIGEVNVFGETQGGIGPEYRTEAVCLAAPLLQLELSVGIGQVEVRRG